MLEHGPITLDIIRAEVRAEGEKVYLGPAEFRLLKYLMMTGRAVSTTELINHLWDSDSRADESNVYNLFSRVRKLLDPQKKLDPVRNIREISGYGPARLRDGRTDRPAPRWMCPASGNSACPSGQGRRFVCEWWSRLRWWCSVVRCMS